MNIEYSSVAEALKALKLEPANSFREQEGWTLVTNRKTFTLWSFTPEGHPAHPAVVKRVMTEKDKQVYLELKALCEGPKPECDKLVNEFTKLTEMIRADIKSGVRR